MTDPILDSDPTLKKGDAQLMNEQSDRERRLEGANKRLRTVRWILILLAVFALIALSIDLGKTFVEPNLFWVALGMNAFIFLVYALGALLLFKRPVLATGACLTLFLLMQLLSVVDDPVAWASGLFWKVLALLALITGFANARIAARTKRELALNTY